MTDSIIIFLLSFIAVVVFQTYREILNKFEEMEDLIKRLGW